MRASPHEPRRELAPRTLARVFGSAIVVAATVMILVGPFILGYIVGQRDGGIVQTPLRSWLSRVGIPHGDADGPPVVSPSPELDALFKPFWETWGYVSREYYDEDFVDATRMSRGAIKGMLSALDDPYSLYLDPSHREISEADLRGAFDGIGVQVEMIDELLQVISPLEGSPGERAGLRPADVITHVDGQEVKGLNLPQAIRLIRGPRGTTVNLTIQRARQPSFDVGVTRDEIRVSAVRGEVRADGLGYVRITSFSMHVGSDLRQTLDRMASRNPRGWVLDLRGNPGGYLDGAVAVASQFIDDGVVLYEQRREGERQEIRTRGRARVTAGPIAVLVDGGTASAAEIVAAAIRDNGRGTIVGEKTFGKGSVQVVHNLTDGSAIRLTVARWLTPSGDPIQGVGLMPGFVIAASEGTDTALESAVDYVRQRSAEAAGPTPSAHSIREEPGRNHSGATDAPVRVVAPPGRDPMAARAADAGDRPVTILDSEERSDALIRGMS
jgi:carboxyl-terminal processing protease